MTFPFKPGPPPGGFRPGPPPAHRPAPVPHEQPVEAFAEASGQIVQETGHPAVDAVLKALENASRLAPAEQIAEYEAAHQVFQETLASIDR
ncbi:hypothetical protein Ade02nite_91240 [Paractinoplanes deccanensis]|uniref:Uncharacterized protein n=1 Tax=Paractinoplanes deccanensis TaxID=113561 RepID=A0ABQ3YKF8_9ACTN|nr:hypothetical protein [Actinoplanes deccanensis]GID80483.1 hypothetical protein Ade02nite_91240 [Actinoplanes deccanensis]